MVGKDTVIVNVEAMKMNNEIRAKVAGTIAEFFVTELKHVDQGDKLFSLKT